MSKPKPTTKAGSLTQAFKAAAVAEPNGALAYMLMAAFGTSLQDITAIVGRALKDGDVAFMRLALTASVQIRNHVVFVGIEFAGIRAKYPELVIDGTRDVGDMFNFGALHAAGHVLAHLTSEDLGDKILKKAGSCITGQGCPESDAGKINKEIAAAWAVEDVTAWRTWEAAVPESQQQALDAVIKATAADARAFKAKIPTGPA